MSRDLARRVTLLENVRSSGGVQYVVSDQISEEEGKTAAPLMSEEEWVARYCTDEHWSDCAVFNEPALPAGSCNCGGLKPGRRLMP